MLIKTIAIEGRDYLAIICDHCQEEITYIKDGECFLSGQAPNTVYFLHKKCTNEWEAEQVEAVSFDV
jgi:hypothetical protein